MRGVHWCSGRCPVHTTTGKKCERLELDTVQAVGLIQGLYSQPPLLEAYPTRPTHDCSGHVC